MKSSGLFPDVVTMIDALTLFISTFLTYFALTLVLFQAWLQNRSQFEGLGYWVLSLLMPTLTLALVSLRGSLPDLLSIVLALSLLPVGCYFMIEGFARFFAVRYKPWIHIAFACLFLPVVAYFSYVQPDVRMRIAAFNIVTAIQYLLAAHLLQVKVTPEHRELGRLSAVILVLMAFCNGWRIYLSLIAEPSSQRFVGHPLDPLPLMLIQVLTVLLVISWLMMVNRRHSVLLQKSQQEIERREKRYKAVVDSSPSGIAIIDQEERIVFANAQFSRLLKLNPEEVIGTDFKQYVVPEHRAMCANIFRDRQAGVPDVPARHDVGILGPNGRIKHIEVQGIIFEKTEAYCHTLVQATDITARKKSEEALMDYQRNLEDMLRGNQHSPSIIRGFGAGV